MYASSICREIDVREEALREKTSGSIANDNWKELWQLLDEDIKFAPMVLLEMSDLKSFAMETFDEHTLKHIYLTHRDFERVASSTIRMGSRKWIAILEHAMQDLNLQSPLEENLYFFIDEESNGWLYYPKLGQKIQA